MIEKIIETLFEAKNQIELFHWKFKETGSGNKVITNINVLLDDLKEEEDTVLELKNKLEECENSKSKILEEEKEKIIAGMKEVTNLILLKEKLRAVKKYMEISGKPLKTSKDFIDVYSAELVSLTKQFNEIKGSSNFIIG